jgi:hypothetical protein
MATFLVHRRRVFLAEVMYDASKHLPLQRNQAQCRVDGPDGKDRKEAFSFVGRPDSAVTLFPM